MRKYTFMIIGLVVAALALGSCGVKGGTIIVKNNAEYSILGASIKADLKVNITNIVLIPLKSGTVPKNGQQSFNMDDDGTYTIALDLLDATSLAASTAGVKVSPSSVTLSGGNTVTVTLK